LPVKSQAGGYIYGLKESPTGKYFFVGNSYEPWRSIARHLKDSSNREFKTWAKNFQKSHPFIDLLSQEIVDRWNLAKDNNILLEEIPFKEPPIPEGKFRLYWDVLGYQDDTFSYVGTYDSEPEKGTVKNYIIQDLINKGHPLLNGKAGRRKIPKISFS